MGKKGYPAHVLAASGVYIHTSTWPVRVTATGGQYIQEKGIMLSAHRVTVSPLLPEGRRAGWPERNNDRDQLDTVITDNDDTEDYFYV